MQPEEWVFYLSLFCIVVAGTSMGMLRLLNRKRARASSPAPALSRPVSDNKPVASSIADSDPRVATLQAVDAIPLHVPLQQTTKTTIPLLFDGRNWHNVELGRDGHWGVFGTTGSGKGNALQIIALAALGMGPQAVQLVVLDGKGGLDYGFCKRIQHATLYKATSLASGCDAILQEMYNRIVMLEQVDARNLFEYNAIAAERLPLLVVIADEIADFAKEDRAKIETFARMARAVGGVLFVATQYPTVDVLSNQIQSNVTNRAVFRLSSSEYTRVALRRQKSDTVLYEPSAIPKARPGVAVLRQDAGNEAIGRAAELTDEKRQAIIQELAERYPKSETPDAERLVKQVQTQPKINEEDLVQEWVDAGCGLREMARKLYRVRNGLDENAPIEYKGDGELFYEVKRMVVSVSA